MRLKQCKWNHAENPIMKIIWFWFSPSPPPSPSSNIPLWWCISVVSLMHLALVFCISMIVPKVKHSFVLLMWSVRRQSFSCLQFFKEDQANQQFWSEKQLLHQMPVTFGDLIQVKVVTGFLYLACCKEYNVDFLRKVCLYFL